MSASNAGPRYCCPSEVRRSATSTSSGRTSPFPIIIAEWPRTGAELVRVGIDRFENHFILDVRCWIRGKDGVLKPRRNGLTLGIRHLPKLVEVLTRAREHAELWSLVEPAVHIRKIRTTERDPRRLSSYRDRSRMRSD
jgi:hypothetical protein